MKGIVLALMLISPFSFADWGDVYYCQMTTQSKTTIEGERTDYELGRFQFKLDETKKAMVFGKKSFFEDVVLELHQQASPSIEVWIADDRFAKLFFKRDKFNFVSVALGYSISISADCEKF